MGPLVGATELAKSLMEAGNKLLESQSSAASTLTLLDEIESLLATVEQDPSEPVKKSLIPSMRALVSTDLLRNPDSDVRVSVVSCLTEIMRITAPEAPYDDDQMKDIFEVTIESFGRLADGSVRSYKKIEAVLDTVSKVRSALVMMDLECDELILQMFRQFVKLISPSHPGPVFNAMETIMVTVVEESEEISRDLVDILLAVVKKDNQGVSPRAKDLVEKVLSECASTLKPCIMNALTLSRDSVDMYSPVVLSICESESATSEANDVVDAKNEADEIKSEKQEVPSDSLEEKMDVVPSRKGSRSKRTARISTGNGDDKLKLGQSESTDAETESGSTRKRGWKPNTLMNPEEGYSFKASLSKKVAEKEPGDSSLAKPAVKKASLAKVGQANQSVVTSHSSADRTKTRSRKRSRSKVEEANPDTDSVPAPKAKKQAVKKDPPEEEDLMESSLEKPEDGTKTAKSSKKERTQNGSAKTSAKKPLAETKMVKTSGKKPVQSVAQKKNSKGASTDTTTPQSSKSKKKGSLAKTTASSSKESEKTGKSKTTAPSKESEKTGKSNSKTTASSSKESEKTGKSNPKRKRTAEKEVESSKNESGEDLVGKRVKVWWPLDKEFYEGVVDSYCKKKKTHKVLYSDGESENLNLSKERWEIIEDHSSASEDKEENDLSETVVLADFVKKTKAKKKKSASKNVEPSSSPEARSSVQTVKKKETLTNSAKKVKKTEGSLKAPSNEPESSEVKKVESSKKRNAKSGRTKGGSQKRKRVSRAGKPESEKDTDEKEEPETKGGDSKRDPEGPNAETGADEGVLKSTEKSNAEPETDGEKQEVAKESTGEPKIVGEEQEVAKEPTAKPNTDGDEDKSVKDLNAEPGTDEEVQKSVEEPKADDEEQKSVNDPNAEPGTDEEQLKSVEEPNAELKADEKEQKSKEPNAEPKADGDELKSVKETNAEPETDEEKQKSVEEPNAEPKADEAEHKSLNIPNAEPETEVQEGESAEGQTEEDTKLIEKDDMSEEKRQESAKDASPSVPVPETAEVEDAPKEIKEPKEASGKTDDGTIPVSA